jgi:ADP-ribosylglycohydrolase
MTPLNNKTLAFMFGSMVGDALGLPCEGLSRSRVGAIRGDRPLHHTFLFGRGMISDDTEHMLLTASAWLAASSNRRRFENALAARLRMWMLSIPPATGLATARACLRLLIGLSARSSGVRSAGNGPIMRTGVLGTLGLSDDALRDAVEASTLITHRDDRALHGALAIAIAARIASLGGTRQDMLQRLRADLHRLIPAGALAETVGLALDSVERGEPTSHHAQSIGCEKGVSGYILHTVPIVLHTWLTHDDFTSGVDTAIRLGGDTDTVAAAAGGLLAASDSGATLPSELVHAIVDFPASRATIARTATCLADPGQPHPHWKSRQLLALPRNLLFLIVVLIHAARRLLPPYVRISQRPPTSGV